MMSSTKVYSITWELSIGHLIEPIQWIKPGATVRKSWKFGAVVSLSLRFHPNFFYSRYRRVGKSKVSSRKRRKVEYRRTEGDPRNTQASFRLQDFKMWKWYTVLLLLVAYLLAFPVNSNETPEQITGVCTVCQDHRCATDTTAIWKGNSDNLWKKEISNCSTGNLNSDVPCRMPNGWLVLMTDQHVLFEWRISGAEGTFTSGNMSCTELNLPSKPSSGILDLLTGNYAIGIGVGLAVISVAALIVAGIVGGLIYKKRRNSCGQGQDRDHRHGNNGVPPHDAEGRNEITIEIQPLNAEDANGNVNGVHWEDGSIVTTGFLGHCDDSPV